MKKNKIKAHVILLLCFFISLFTSAQNCDCQENLKFLSKKVEVNYPGFKDKVVDRTRSSYKKNLRRLLNLAEGEKGISCFYILSEYMAYFRDQHLSVNILLPKDTLSLRQFFSSTPKVLMDTNAIKREFSKAIHGIEGIWELNSASGYYRIAIKKTTPGRFMGIILKADSVYWLPNQIKLKAHAKQDNVYDISYFLKDHSIRNESVTYSNNGELVINGSTWRRVFPTLANVNVTQNIKRLKDGFIYKQLSRKTALLRLPNFFLPSKVAIDSLIRENKIAIEETENLIIDIRDNPGGTVYAYRELVKYFYTNPIYLQMGLYKSSNDNIQHYKSRLNDSSSSEAYKQSLLRLVEKLEANKGQLVEVDTAEFYMEDSIISFPKKIGIVINNNCTSAAELFLLDFRQSTKAITFGKRTKGVVDYLNGRLNQPLICSFYSYNYPLLKRKNSITEPLDNIGIKPDIQLNAPESDWISIIQQHFEHSKK